ncbi:MAG TPA: redox-sensing transcriptional repressor Rex [bacterium]|nr:redox-sensing transcriptional repressor Rex [bacterium]
MTPRRSSSDMEMVAAFARRRISESTIRRLSVYYRALGALEAEGYHTVSSRDLAEREKLTPAQVRKDLSAFGSFGTRGLGYPARELRARIGRILGLDREWNVGIVGVGHLGSALVSYKEFQKQGFTIRALFDNDQRKIGSNHKGVVIADIKDLPAEIKKRKLSMIILAVPASVAQSVCDLAVSAGIKAFLNFAQVNLKVPPDVIVRTENMAMELEFLSFHLSNRAGRERNPG